MAVIQNLTIDQGSTFRASVNIADDNNASIDLTGYTFSAQIRKAPTSSTVSATFECTSPAPETGAVIIALTDEETSAIKAGRYMYDLYIEDTVGRRYRAIEGMVTVTPSITR